MTNRLFAAALLLLPLAVHAAEVPERTIVVGASNGESEIFIRLETPTAIVFESEPSAAQFPEMGGRVKFTQVGKMVSITPGWPLNRGERPIITVTVDGKPLKFALVMDPERVDWQVKVKRAKAELEVDLDAAALVRLAMASSEEGLEEVAFRALGRRSAGPEGVISVGGVLTMFGVAVLQVRVPTGAVMDLDSIRVAAPLGSLKVQAAGADNNGLTVLVAKPDKGSDAPFTLELDDAEGRHYAAVPVTIWPPKAQRTRIH